MQRLETSLLCTPVVRSSARRRIEKRDAKASLFLNLSKNLLSKRKQVFPMVRGTGLELTRHHISLYYPVSKSTANKTSVEVVHVRQC